VYLEWGKVVKTINWTFVFNLINFGILLYLLKRLLFKPALEYLDRRREQVAGRIKRAKEDEQRAEELAKQRLDQLQQARDESRHIIEQGREQAESLVAQGKQDAKSEAHRILESARSQIAQEKDEMQQDLRKAYAEIAVMGASQVLHREINPEDHRRLLDELLEGVEESELETRR